MSDDDFMQEDEEFDFEYSGSEDEQDSVKVDLENKYYKGKGLKANDPTAALGVFNEICVQEKEMGEWGFKAIKQSVKVSFALGNYDQTLDFYVRLLPYSKIVTKNEFEKSINNILDLVSAAQDLKFMEKIYEITLESLSESKNDRLWTKTNLKLAKLWLQRKEHSKMSRILRLLHQACKNVDGSADQQKGTLMLEIYALEIQMYTETKNNQKLKEVYQKCLLVKSAIPHPKIMGLIRECGGKMHMYEKEWEEAQTDFFEAFKNYDEAGSPQRIQCLKYLVLANMLIESEINPFASQETKPYENDPSIVSFRNLVHAFQSKDIKQFEKILRENGKDIMNDDFICEYIGDVLKNIRSQFIQQLVKPYLRIEIGYIANVTFFNNSN